MNALEVQLRAMIAEEGPMSVERYMGLALAHPKLGYYMSQNAIGAVGDFITAPEISQMFGELIGLWAAQTWHLLGEPQPLRLVELGPGKGTMMSDVLRSARISQQFFSSLDVHLVETSPRLMQAQEATLAGSALPIQWHRSVMEVPPGPMIVLANEFFDALPVRHYVRRDGAWRECCVMVGEDDRLIFAVAPTVEAAITHVASEGEMLEIGAAGYRFMSALAARLAAQGGAALIIDYGHTVTGFGETLQALKGHQYVHPLADPGECDLTTHVDFAALARAARAQGLAVHGPVTQGAFLREIGIESRAQALAKRANERQRAQLSSALARLTEGGKGMGELFKVMAVAVPGVAPLPGFSNGALS